MKILTGSRIREADRYTIAREPIDSIALMERASESIAQWVAGHVRPECPLAFFVGKGNNGGDGLAVARMLHRAGFSCAVYLAFGRDELSEECRFNLERLPRGLPVRPMAEASLPEGTVIVDALLGTGVRGELTEPLLGAVRRINSSGCRVVSIDLPSGMFSEFGNAGRTTVRATTTLTLEFPKLALLLPEGGEAAGEVVVLPIGLSEEYMDRAESLYFYTDAAAAARLPLSRPKFAHKGNCGHALLVCGSEDMAGAAVLATGAALRSGCGLVTVHLPRSERVSVHANSPSAIVSGDPEPVFSRLPRDMGRYDAVGVGPGVGQDPRSFEALEALLRAGLPAVIDADALNMLSARTELQRLVARGSILTPHLGELRRLAGDWASEDEKIEKTRDLASRLGCCVVVKGAHTMVCSSDGRCFFNSSGNPGMAKGGSGDVLTGFLAGLLARGYESLAAAILGVYLHGRAGDRAADYYGQEAMNAGDLIDFLSEAQQEILGRDNG